ncbi:MAG TPA: Lrp/AsnC family transcriptional regulator [Fimbriimonadaceae bacterium]|nr:Lrp/AsnC family transcriptional regulator [Fimbriimonadaceae bacterium]
MKTQLDEKDLQILRLLQANGRMTNADLARAIGLSAPSTLQRVRQLELAGVLKDYVAVLDHERLGLKVTVFANIQLSLHQEQPIEQFRRAIEDIPEVIECYNVSGEHDYLLKVLVRDIRSYEKLVRERLSRIKGVGRITSSIALATYKQSHRIPL